MKAFGYVCEFLILLFSAFYLASHAPKGNVELALLFGILIPIVMLFTAGVNGDID